MRAFVALELPDALKAALSAVQDRLDIDKAGGRAVDEDQMHLTLVFLDDQPEHVLADLHGELDRVRWPAVTLSPRGLGTFGGDRVTSVWAGVAPDPVLDGLQAKVAQAARDAGMDIPRRRFVPHVTLARFGAQGAPGPFNAGVAALSGWSAPPVAVDRMALMRSHLGKGGSVYEVLADYPLG
ncbi:MAG: RNA 2',3'-cyclic phosphodiesterase [Rhodobacteraceae bacterium]|jgi:2'-5' RNA ligase|nr:RNA 2',3'-cyclic phosphodiesterase [Paracoccaceae bacterium]